MSETFKGAKIVKSQVKGVIHRSEVLAEFGKPWINDADQILEFAIETLREGIDDLQNAQLEMMRSKINLDRDRKEGLRDATA